MKGGVRRRGDTWSYYFAEPSNEGTRRHFTKSGFRTKRDAEAALAEALAQRQAGSYVAPSTLTLATYIRDNWLPTVATAIRPSTLDNYRRNLEQHVLPAIGGVRLQDISPHHLNQLYASLLEGGHRTQDKGLSPKTVRNIHVAIRKALADAQAWSLIRANPAAVARSPRLTQASNRQTWRPNEVAAFLQHVAGDRLSAAWQLAATTGMRRGEVLGLRWRDLDLDRNVLAVRQAIVSVAYEIKVSEPKTARGRRTIALDSATAAAIRQHGEQQRREWWHPRHPTPDQLVFVREDGQSIHPDRFTQMFDKHVRNAALPRIRLHDLRHTHATLALQAGVHPKIVSERLGHATVAFTLDTYSHALPHLQADAAETMRALIRPTDPSPDLGL